MKVVITGGAGFLGARLAAALAARGSVPDADGKAQTLRDLLLVDQAEHATVPPGGRYLSCDIAAPGACASFIDADVDVVVHLAAVVSAGAEADFDLGMRVNVDATRALLERCRALRRPPRVIFTSSVAAFGAAPALVDDRTATTPQSSYGTQKVIGELLLNDYTRKGFVDGRCLRLPTITIRPGRPNQAASSFASSILREPLAGEPAVCPVPAELGVWIASPRTATAALLRGIDLPAAAWGQNRVLNVPGISVTVAEMVGALERAGGDSTLVRFEPDARIGAIVATWPARMDTPRAQAMGFRADADLDAIVKAYLEDDAPRRA